ncbi:putative quinone oxidoreductase, YhdH/YhfP family [Paenibacillus sp. UNCCL117]|uniref:acrylyl-CoA reductase family protein n=1 Tax=unclassified Paenibacillus TaxID=185978 RepID=UPI00088CC92D|nr:MULTISPECIES: acryloyl-CoA reductase [unclassified Paenibacillus]SDD40870.1 putative quinone oxidoreductase, YhdH/YhfP family [Paenibacillus sp. cl123]SFW47989.1 putative quinone oxidoreductase, YhdH/YhfP family [Paenibacillus sp. UNCCL117]
MDTFKAYLLEKAGDAASGAVKELSMDRLPQGEVTIRVHYSSVNYKDGLAALPVSPIVKSYPFIPGIDLAGVVEHSEADGFSPGDPVLVTGYELGVTHYGGFSQYARVPASWVVPLPEGLTMLEAMALGTAGFTAALSLAALERNGLQPGDRTAPVLVTGATGGVGSVAVSLLAASGYRVTASTGKASEHDYLRQLGADSIIGRDELRPADGKPLRRELWAGAIDPVGGEALAYTLGTIRYGGAAAVSGLTGGAAFAATVYPFILRGVSLLGIDSVGCPMAVRQEVWSKLASVWKPISYLNAGWRMIGLPALPEALERIQKGQLRGRVIVKLWDDI